MILKKINKLNIWKILLLRFLYFIKKNTYTIFLLFDIDVGESFIVVVWLFADSEKPLRQTYIFLWKKKTQMKSVGRMSRAAFRCAHNAHLLHFGMDFPLTKEARVSTDPHNWHTKSGKTKHGNHLLSSLKLVLIFCSKRAHSDF